MLPPSITMSGLFGHFLSHACPVVLQGLSPPFGATGSQFLKSLLVIDIL
jgi:hypothetical protein